MTCDLGIITNTTLAVAMQLSSIHILFLHSVLFDSVLTSYRGGTPELFAPRRTTFPSRTADSVVVVTLEKDGEACPPATAKTVCRFFASHTFDSLRCEAQQLSM